MQPQPANDVRSSCSSEKFPAAGTKLIEDRDARAEFSRIRSFYWLGQSLDCREDKARGRQFGKGVGVEGVGWSSTRRWLSIHAAICIVTALTEGWPWANDGIKLRSLPDVVGRCNFRLSYRGRLRAGPSGKNGRVRLYEWTKSTRDEHRKKMKSARRDRRRTAGRRSGHWPQ